MYFSVLSVLLVSSICSLTQAALIKYGEICRMLENFEEYYFPDYSETNLLEDPDICNFKYGKCIDNKCQCEYPDVMIYNGDLQECGIPLGNHCNDSMAYCFIGSQCTDNSCSCEYPREQVAIIESQSHDSLISGAISKCTSLRQEECHLDMECSSKEFLSCFEGYCDCKNPMRTIYEEADPFSQVSSGCKIRAGELCTIKSGLSAENNLSSSFQQCISNAECKLFNSSSVSKQGQDNNGICTCIEGYTSSTPDGLCKKDYLELCTPSFQECNSYKGLTCKNQTCTCIDEDTCYDKEQKMCVSYVDEPCGLFSLWYDEYDIGCVKNADCVSVKNNSKNSTTSIHHQRVPVTSRKVCKCKDGFTELANSDGKECVQIESNSNNNNDYDYSVPTVF